MVTAIQPVRYLTATSLRSFRTCERQFFYAHVLRLRKSVRKGVLEFGSACHAGIESFYLQGVKPADEFEKIWTALANTPLEFNRYDTHAGLMKIGCALMNKFLKKHPTDPHTLETQRTAEAKGVPLLGILDWTGKKGRMLIDWKTAASAYTDYKAWIDSQLTFYTYLLAVNERFPEWVGFGVLVKKKDPEIQYTFAKRTPEDLKQFENLVRKQWDRIQHCFETGMWDMNDGQTCSYCDFLDLCLGKDIPDGAFYRREDRNARTEGLAAAS